MDSWEPREPQPEASLVRPYVLTAGRTSPRVDLPLEAPVETVDAGTDTHRQVNDVSARILRLATDGPSVAEIAARLSIPLGVARVLIGDLVVQGYLRVHATLSDTATTDERRELIGRTLRGLRAL
ncbi:DUF742 domain-containing protein [Mycolicibacterium sediminis]|uniref:Uncharacterized protein n=1 Tax=Mycolicibacterium sediminis TaxID=1286180 RepID=A0A7I7QR76_9MYCO|nr:DUF742 domain-containing protein [Mycolicibacterium sediminis]BBY28447.1 hypothetical protein MSEDJ_25430 [Mycolicibacterium sediminis]